MKVNYRLLLLVSLALQLLIYFDFYCFPLSKTTEKVTEAITTIHGKRRQFYTYKFVTEKREYRVREYCYRNIVIDEKVEIERTFFLKAITNVYIKSEGLYKTYPIDFFYSSDLFGLLIGISVLSFLFFVFYYKIKISVSGKNNLVIALLIISTIVLFFLVYY